MSEKHASCHGYEDAARRRESISRRTMLGTLGLGLIGWMATPKTALAQVSIEPNPAQERDVLVVVFLRGGMDGLNVVVPYAEEDYYRRRPTIKLAAPNDTRAASADRVLDLDGFFGLHPAMKSLMPIYQSGQLAAIQAVGSGDQTRSHFEAMSAMERGLYDDRNPGQSGWLARYLSAQQAPALPMRAIALGTVMPDSLLGATQSVTIPSLDAYKLLGDDGFATALRQIYSTSNDRIGALGEQTLTVLDKLKDMDPLAYKPAGRAYPNSELGEGLKQVAMLIKAGVGLEVACLDRGGWDTHVGQGGSTGWLAGNVQDVADSMAAFHADMGSKMSRISVVVMTEFGRRVYENTGYGTDHGRASCMFVMGGGVKPNQKVQGFWPGLRDDQIEQPGDLRVTTDYRDVLAELLSARMGLADVGQVFEGLAHKPIGIAQML